jgi:hypothetical protein
MAGLGVTIPRTGLQTCLGWVGPRRDCLRSQADWSIAKSVAGVFLVGAGLSLVFHLGSSHNESASRVGVFLGLISRRLGNLVSPQGAEIRAMRLRQQRWKVRIETRRRS